MEKRAGHGKGVFTLLDYSGSSLGNNVAGLGVGHGYGPVLRLERNVGKHKFVSSSPAFEVTNSIGYAFGHGRCFYRSQLPFVDPFIFDDNNNNNDEQDDQDDILENLHFLINRRIEIESSSSSSSSDNDEEDDESSTTSSRPDSGIGL